MKSHRHTVQRLRRLAIGLAAVTALVPTSATAIADPGAGQPATAGAYAKAGDTPADFPGATRSSHTTTLAPVGDTPADFPGATRSPDVTTLTKVGDTPADFPGVSGSPDVTTPIVLVRPERTIVHEANQALPIALSSAALVIVLMGAAFLLVRARVQRRHVVRASH